MINALMLQEHGQILALLNESEKDFRKFDAFREALENHFEVEEKAIFVYYNDISDGEVGDFFELLKEHGMILGLVNSIEKKPGNFGELKEMLINHASFENSVFYPKLDMMLNEGQQKDLVKRIKEILIRNV
jgi:hypothetical protein